MTTFRLASQQLDEAAQADRLHDLVHGAAGLEQQQPHHAGGDLRTARTGRRPACAGTPGRGSGRFSSRAIPRPSGRWISDRPDEDDHVVRERVAEDRIGQHAAGSCPGPRTGRASRSRSICAGCPRRPGRSAPARSRRRTTRAGASSTTSSISPAQPGPCPRTPRGRGSGRRAGAWRPARADYVDVAGRPVRRIAPSVPLDLLALGLAHRGDDGLRRALAGEVRRDRVVQRLAHTGREGDVEVDLHVRRRVVVGQDLLAARAWTAPTPRPGWPAGRRWPPNTCFCTGVLTMYLQELDASGSGPFFEHAKPSPPPIVVVGCAGAAGDRREREPAELEAELLVRGQAAP